MFYSERIFLTTFMQQNDANMYLDKYTISYPVILKGHIAFDLRIIIYYLYQHIMRSASFAALTKMWDPLSIIDRTSFNLFYWLIILLYMIFSRCHNVTSNHRAKQYNYRVCSETASVATILDARGGVKTHLAACHNLLVSS